jgi:hypothetical protein
VRAAVNGGKVIGSLRLGAVDQVGRVGDRSGPDVRIGLAPDLSPESRAFMAKFIERRKVAPGSFHVGTIQWCTAISRPSKRPIGAYLVTNENYDSGIRQ